MRLTLAVLGTCVLAAAACAEPVEIPSIKALRELHGDDFFRGVSLLRGTKPRLRFSDGVELGAHWARELAAFPDHTPDFDFVRFFGSLCQQASDSELSPLVQIYGTIEPSDWAKSDLLVPLSNRWIRRELKQIASEHIRIEREKTHAEASPVPKNVSPLINRAIQMYSAFLPASPAPEGDENDDKGIVLFANEKAFFALVQKVLAREGKGHAAELARYSYGGDCIVVGAGGIDDARNRSLLMAYLSERQLKKAAQAALRLAVDPSTSNDDEDEDTFDPTVETLRTGGFDYETLLAGAIASQQISGGFGNLARQLQELAMLRTDKAAKLLLETVKTSSEDDRADFIRAIETLLADRMAPLGHDDSIEVPSYDKKLPPGRVSVGMRAPFLALLRKWSSKDVSNLVGQALVHCLGKIDSREVIPSLRELLQHPAHEVSADAAVVLRAMGEKVPDQSEPSPVRYQILVNGERLPADMMVSWQIEYQAGGSVSCGSRTDDDGILEVDRDDFVDPARPVSGVVLSSLNGDQDEAPTFGRLLPPPKDLDKITTVDVTLRDVSITLTPADPGLWQRLADPVSVTLRPLEREDLSTRLPSASWSGSAKEGGAIRLQEGTYELETKCRGAAIAKANVTISGEQKVITIPLRTGTDLHVAIIPPNKEDHVQGTLLCNGKETNAWPLPDGTYQGLPPGNYVLHIPSAQQQRDEADIQAGPDESDYAGRDVAVTISDNSPNLIDLGEIHLEPVVRAKAKR